MFSISAIKSTLKLSLLFKRYVTISNHFIDHFVLNNSPHLLLCYLILSSLSIESCSSWSEDSCWQSRSIWFERRLRSVDSIPGNWWPSCRLLSVRTKGSPGKTTTTTTTRSFLSISISLSLYPLSRYLSIYLNLSFSSRNHGSQIPSPFPSIHYLHSYSTMMDIYMYIIYMYMNIDWMHRIVCNGSHGFDSNQVPRRNWNWYRFRICSSMFLHLV